MRTRHLNSWVLSVTLNSSAQHCHCRALSRWLWRLTDRIISAHQVVLVTILMWVDLETTPKPSRACTWQVFPSSVVTWTGDARLRLASLRRLALKYIQHKDLISSLVFQMATQILDSAWTSWSWYHMYLQGTLLAGRLPHPTLFLIPLFYYTTGFLKPEEFLSVPKEIHVTVVSFSQRTLKNAAVQLPHPSSSS